jgi:hypothetical protein
VELSLRRRRLPVGALKARSRWGSGGVASSFNGEPAVRGFGRANQKLTAP